MVCEVLDNICVKSQDTESVSADDTRQELHDKNFVIERKPLVKDMKNVIKLLGESLRIVEKLKSRKISC